MKNILKHDSEVGHFVSFFLLEILEEKKNHLIIQRFAFIEWSGGSKQANKHEKVMFLIM